MSLRVSGAVGRDGGLVPRAPVRGPLGRSGSHHSSPCWAGEVTEAARAAETGFTSSEAGWKPGKMATMCTSNSTPKPSLLRRGLLGREQGCHGP